MIEQIINAFNNYNLPISDKQAETFYDYYTLLMQWNDRTNLTAITDYESAIHKHYLDSCSAIKFELFEDSETIIDIGSGAGFPGIPLAIMMPQKQVTLLEARVKKTEFLQTAIHKLELDNCNVINGRAEEVAHNTEYREKFDIAVSRAVSDMPVLCEYSLPFIRIVGTLIAYRGKSNNEMDINALKDLGVAGYECIDARIEGMEHYLLVVKKNSMTNNIYPRRQKQIIRRPIIFENMD